MIQMFSEYIIYDEEIDVASYSKYYNWNMHVFAKLSKDNEVCIY